MSRTVRRKKTKEKGLVVGVITMPHAPGKSHIMKSYVDWLEEEGVQVVPVPFDTDSVELYYQILHGLVIPGGDTEYVVKKEPTLLRTVHRFLMLAMRPGEHFPIWSVCLGYELVMALLGGFRNLERIEDQTPRYLVWSVEGKRSTMYRGLGPEGREAPTEQNHLYGISPKRFGENKRLRTVFDVYATAMNRNGEEYVSIVKAKKWPVVGVMFHPERQPNRQAFARVFLSEVRKSRHARGLIQKVVWKGSSSCVQYPEHAGRECYFF